MKIKIMRWRRTESIQNALNMADTGRLKKDYSHEQCSTGVVGAILLNARTRDSCSWSKVKNIGVRKKDIALRCPG